MKKFIVILFLFPLFLCAGERKKQIFLVHDWPIPREDPSIKQSHFLIDACKALQEKQASLRVVDLSKEKDINELTYVVVWGKPDYLKSNMLERFPKKKLLLFAWEPPVVKKGRLYEQAYLDHFKRVYTWNDEIVDNKKFFKLYYPALQPMIKDIPSFEQKKLVTQMSSNKKSHHPQELYSARESVIQFFEDKPGVFDFYGFAWEEKGYKNYRGSVENKLETIKNYRFNVCYENMSDVKGYVTEKIFDSFAAGVVPIYWGASNIADYVPKNCFIDRRDFKDFNAVYDYIRKMDKPTYEAYLKNIQDYLQSDQAKLFSPEMFSTIFLEAIRFP